MVNTNCAVFGCMVSSFKNKDARFHQFPRSAERYKRWLQACQRPDLEGKSYESLKFKNICNRHFEKCMYGKRGLKKMAIPTLYLPTATETVYVKHNIEADVYVRSAHTQTEQATDSVSSRTDDSKPHIWVKPEIPGPSTQFECSVVLSCDNGTQTTETSDKKRSRKRAFEPQTKKRKPNKSDTKKEFLSNCDKFLPSDLSALAKSQVGSQQPSKYTKEFKQLCLDMYMESPKAYQALSSILELPSKLELANMGTEISTWDLLKTTIKHLTRSERKCVMCLEAMKLKPGLSYNSKEDRIIGLHELDCHPQQLPIVAEYAVTLMLQGIGWDWKLAVAFTLTSNIEVHSIKRWLINMARKIFDVGFDIRALVSDTKIDLSKCFGITKDNSSFLIAGYNMYYIYDMLDLTNCIRDNLMKYNFEFEGKTADWEDLIKMNYLDEQNNSTRLNDSHIRPNSIQKEQFQYAAYVFSDPIATALKEYESSGALIDTGGTVEFIEIMAKLLNSLIYNDETSCHTSEEILDRVQNIFSDLKVKNKIDNNDVTVRFKDNLNITIDSMKRLEKHSDIQHIWIHINKINNDCLKNLFHVVRRVSGTRKPNCLQFAQAFQKHYLCLILNLCEGSNLTTDVTEILEKYTEFVKHNPVKEKVQKVIQIFTKKNYEIPKENSFDYICVYLMKRCAIRHKSKCLASIEIPQNDNHTDDFFHYIHCLETEFESDFYELMGPKIGQRLYERLSSIEFRNKPCECYPIDFLIKLFIRMRIFYLIEYNNRNLYSRKDGKIYVEVPNL